MRQRVMVASPHLQNERLQLSCRCVLVCLSLVEGPREVLMLAGCECPLDLQNEQSAAHEAMQSGRSCALVLWDIAACDVMQRIGDVVSV